MAEKMIDASVFRRFILLAACFFTCCQVYSQKHDYNYLFKRSQFGSAVIITYDDFLQDIKIELNDWQGTTSGSPALSDKEGHFLGHFNSRKLYDSIGRVAINGDSMAVGFFLNYFFQFYEEDIGIGNKGNCAFIPINDSLYYLFYGSAELWIGAPDYAIEFMEMGFQLSSYTDGLYLTKVRLNPSGRLYILPEEKNQLLVDDLFQLAHLMFVKDALSDGWWLIVPKALDRNAARLSLSASGDIQVHDDTPFSDNFWRVRSDRGFDFSGDGRYLARIIHRSNAAFKDILEVFSFDRCTGSVTLIKEDSLPLPPHFTYKADVKFANEALLFYVALGSYVLQYKIENDHQVRLIDTIGIYDQETYLGFHPLFDRMWRLPNGKILISGMDFTPYLHYIQYPDLEGTACGFLQKAIELPADPLNEGFASTVRNLPNFPPYRMPPLAEPCETSTEENSAPAVLNVFPNPAIDIFSITCSAPIDEVIIFDLQGRKLKSIWIHGVQDHYECSLEDWPGGMYLVLCRDKAGQIVGSKKLVKK